MSAFAHNLPVIKDDSGYEVTAQDLVFLGIPTEGFVRVANGERPLGFSDITFTAFVEGLWEALRDDGLTVDEVDVRLKGSSSTFFAGPHKEMPTSRDEIVALFRALRRRLPEVFEVLEIESRLGGAWPIPSRPRRRPFDSMFVLGVDLVRSDYDLQISSDAIVERCEAAAQALGVVATREVTISKAYDFVKRDLVFSAMPHLSAFSQLMSDALNRGVSLAVFTSEGPPDRSAELGGLSAHFRDTDWRLLPPVPGAPQ